jgi:cytochrome c biogenesis protein
MGLKSLWSKLYGTLSSVRTGIFLIIIVGVFSAIGTVILQRPTSEPGDIQRAYAPETLAWLDRLGLTDIYHSWWFLTLLVLFCVCLLFVSVDRWPNSWKVYSKPVRFAASHFRLGLPQSIKLPVNDEAASLSVAERILGRFGFKAQRVSEGGENGLFAEKQRYSVLAVYVVHLSLLFIFAGYIVDGIVGYRGSVNITEGQTASAIMVRDNKGSDIPKQIPFSIRCDGAGMEAYESGAPKQWWSNLVILEDGKEVLSKRIIVNDPLVYKGLHIYQANMGKSQVPKTLTFTATPAGGGAAADVEVPLQDKAALPDGESLSILRWVPDYYVQDGEVYQKSDRPENPAVQLGVTNAKGETKKVWIFYTQANSTKGQDAPYEFSIKAASWLNFTGLEISRHPGQLGVWIGVVLMAIGLVVAFYTHHQRIWAVVATDGSGGKLLWVGGTTNKNRDKFQAKFEQIKTALNEELGSEAPAKPEAKQDEKNLSHV